MKRAGCVVAVVVVSLSILVACGGQPGPRQSVTGVLIRVGGPATLSHPQNRLPLPGTVVARNAAGHQFTAATGKDGRFELSLPPGRYRLTGHSPQVCRASRILHVAKSEPIRNVQVVCSIS